MIGSKGCAGGYERVFQFEVGYANHPKRASLQPRQEPLLSWLVFALPADGLVRSWTDRSLLAGGDRVGGVHVLVCLASPIQIVGQLDSSIR